MLGQPVMPGDYRRMSRPTPAGRMGRVTQQQGPLRGVVALDGPSGTGKSTVARELAAEWQACYLDTGAMYRAAALAVLRAGADPHLATAVRAVLDGVVIDVGVDPARPEIRLDSVDVGAEIRTDPVTVAVSPVSAMPEVRARLVAAQQSIIADALDRTGGIVVEGRDIGTVVAPDAALKVFLTASADTRAGRRARQDRSTDIAEVHRAVQRRDRFDATRAASPLFPAPDAVELDTTELDVAGVLARLADLLAERGLLAVCERGRV